MRTNVSIMVSSEGGLMSDIAKRFGELGFKPTLGMHDFIYKTKLQSSMELRGVF